MLFSSTSPLAPTQWAPAAQASSPPRVVAIVCAKDEAQRIGPVLDVLVRKLPTLVVDDGSTDGTAQVAISKGATVLRLSQNRGKGNAMLAGMNATPWADIVLFMDADLLGLRPEHIDQMVMPVLNGSFGMVIGMRDYGNVRNDVVRKFPLISGQRAVRRDLLRLIPPEGWQGFAVETWMNHAVAASGQPIGTTVLQGLSVVLKWEKEGVSTGFVKMVDMGAEVVKAHVQIANPSVTGPINSSSDDVMRALSRTLVDASGPYVKEHLWTPNAQRQVGDAIGRRIAMPLWGLACVACAGVFGPAAGLATAVGALAIHHRSYFLKDQRTF